MNLRLRVNVTLVQRDNHATTQERLVEVEATSDSDAQLLAAQIAAATCGVGWMVAATAIARGNAFLDVKRS